MLGQTTEQVQRVNSAQNALAVLNAQINAIGRGNWNDVAALVNNRRQMGEPVPYFVDFDMVVNFTYLFLRPKEEYPDSLLVTATQFPSDAAVSRAEARISELRGMVDAARSYLSNEDLDAADQAGWQLEQKLQQTPLVSPEVAGDEAFAESLSERAKIFGIAGFSVATVVLIAIGAVALMNYLGALRRK